MRRREIGGLLGAAMVGRSFGARAQQPPRLGYLSTGASDSPGARRSIEVFRQSLKDVGYNEGQNILIEYRLADNRVERLPDLARDLVALKVDVIFAGATPAGLAAKRATSTIPIVVSAMGDPVGDGLVASFSKPGGNVTGTSFLGPELVPKRLALLRELLPRGRRIGVLWHPGAFADRTMDEMRTEAVDAATALGFQLQFVAARSPDEFEQAFGKMVEVRCEALFQFPSTVLFSNRKQIVDLAAAHRLPMMYNAREFVEIGGLIAYGSNLVELTRRSVAYTVMILKGAKPSELPVELPNKFELFINLKTAKSLGLVIPPTLLARADEVIE